MRLDRTRFILIGVAIAVIGALALIGRSVQSPLQQQPAANEETVQARVIEVLDQGVIDQEGVQQPYQRLRLEILEGELAGRAVVVDHGLYSLLGPEALYQAEDRVMVTRARRPDLGDVFIITDAVRLDALALLSVVFVVVFLLFAPRVGGGPRPARPPR